MTAEESQAAGKKWVAITRKLTGNYDFTGRWMSAVVGDIGSFMWVDTYPSLEVWAATQTVIIL